VVVGHTADCVEAANEGPLQRVFLEPAIDRVHPCEVAIGRSIATRAGVLLEIHRSGTPRLSRIAMYCFAVGEGGFGSTA